MIIVNGKEINLTEDTTVAEYLEQNQYQVKRIAVELNGDILPKYSYSDTMLKDGDRLEVVTFVGGGDSRTWRIGIKCGICTCQNRSRTSPSDRF